MNEQEPKCAFRFAAALLDCGEVKNAHCAIFTRHYAADCNRIHSHAFTPPNVPVILGKDSYPPIKMVLAHCERCLWSSARYSTRAEAVEFARRRVVGLEPEPQAPESGESWTQKLPGSATIARSQQPGICPACSGNGYHFDYGPYDHCTALEAPGEKYGPSELYACGHINPKSRAVCVINTGHSGNHIGCGEAWASAPAQAPELLVPKNGELQSRPEQIGGFGAPKSPGSEGQPRADEASRPLQPELTAERALQLAEAIEILRSPGDADLELSVEMVLEVAAILRAQQETIRQHEQTIAELRSVDQSLREISNARPDESTAEAMGRTVTERTEEWLAEVRRRDAAISERDAVIAKIEKVCTQHAVLADLRRRDGLRGDPGRAMVAEDVLAILKELKDAGPV